MCISVRNKKCIITMVIIKKIRKSKFARFRNKGFTSINAGLDENSNFSFEHIYIHRVLACKKENIS